MRTSGDVIRSFKRYLALGLPGYNVIFDGEEGTAKRPMAVLKSASPTDTKGPHHTLEEVETFDIYIYPAEYKNAQEGRVEAEKVAEAIKQLLGMGIVWSATDKAFVRADGGVGRARELPLYDYTDMTWNEGVSGFAESRLDGELELPATDLPLVDATGFNDEGGLVYVGVAEALQVLTYTGITGDTLTGVSGGEEATVPDNTQVRQYGDRAHCDYARMRDLSVDVKQSPDSDTLYSVLAEVRLAWARGSLLPSNGEMAKSARISFK